MDSKDITPVLITSTTATPGTLTAATTTDKEDKETDPIQRYRDQLVTLQGMAEQIFTLRSQVGNLMASLKHMNQQSYKSSLKKLHLLRGELEIWPRKYEALLQSLQQQPNLSEQKDIPVSNDLLQQYLKERTKLQQRHELSKRVFSAWENTGSARNSKRVRISASSYSSSSDSITSLSKLLEYVVVSYQNNPHLKVSLWKQVIDAKAEEETEKHLNGLKVHIAGVCNVYIHFVPVATLSDIPSKSSIPFRINNIEFFGIQEIMTETNRSKSEFLVFQNISEYASIAGKYFHEIVGGVSDPQTGVHLLLKWLESHHTLFSEVCYGCQNLLCMDSQRYQLIPPTLRIQSKEGGDRNKTNAKKEIWHAYHPTCASADLVTLPDSFYL